MIPDSTRMVLNKLKKKGSLFTLTLASDSILAISYCVQMRHISAFVGNTSELISVNCALEFVFL